GKGGRDDACAADGETDGRTASISFRHHYRTSATSRLPGRRIPTSHNPSATAKSRAPTLGSDSTHQLHDVLSVRPGRGHEAEGRYDGVERQAHDRTDAQVASRSFPGPVRSRIRE